MAAEMHGLGAAVEMLSLAWSDVTPDNFRNCFQHAGLMSEPAHSVSPDHDNSIGELLELANVPDALPKGVSFEDFLSVDDDVAVIMSPSVADTIGNVMAAGASESP